MTTISAAQVKELREITSAGMMECKKALEATQGDMEKAIQKLREQGIAKAGKKTGRIAAEGVIAINTNGKEAIMIEVNCETDFVARDPNFTGFVKTLSEAGLEAKVSNVAQLSALNLTGTEAQTIEAARQALVAKVGENVQVRRLVGAAASHGVIGSYSHGGRIGVIVQLDSDNIELARDIAMHIAASKPLVIVPEDVPAELIEKEKEIYFAQAASSGKPQEIVEKMVQGRLRKYLDEICLVGQAFVKDPEITVGALLSKNRAKVIAFERYEVGEGIEKPTEDFKEAVMSQIQGS